MNLGLFNIANWSIRWIGRRYLPVLVRVTGLPTPATVLLTKAFSLPDPGPNVVSYNPPPFDIKSLATQIPAPAFADFPLVF